MQRTGSDLGGAPVHGLTRPPHATFAPSAPQPRPAPTPIRRLPDALPAPAGMFDDD